MDIKLVFYCILVDSVLLFGHVSVIYGRPRLPGVLMSDFMQM